MEPKIEYIPPTTVPLDDISLLTKDSSIIKIYSNGFQLGFSLSDFNVVLKQNNANLAILVLPVSGAKSLYNQLGALIENYEKITGQQILSIEELNSNKANGNISK